MHKQNLTQYRPRREAGFTLLEVLVAVFVMTVGLLGIASLQARAMQGNHSAFLRTQAATLAYAMLDTWRANHRAVLAGGAPPGLDGWHIRVADTLPDGRLHIERSGEDITVSLSWTDTRYIEVGRTPGDHETDKTTTFTLGGRL